MLYKWTLTDRDGVEHVETTDNPTLIREWIEEHVGGPSEDDVDNIVIEMLD